MTNEINAWQDIRNTYLNKVERALSKVSSPRKKEVLVDVASHLDQKFSALADDQKTWESFQAIITDMGPAEEYAELFGDESPKPSVKKLSLAIVFVIAVIAIATILVPYGMVMYSQIFADSIEDNIDFPFEKDDKVLGVWETVDFVDNANEFNHQMKSWQHELFLHSLKFSENGKLEHKNDNVPNGYGQEWTKGLVICRNGKTASKYFIKEIDGTSYMFYEWKSGDYKFRQKKPPFYILKKKTPQTDIVIKDFKVYPSRESGAYSLVASIYNNGVESSGQFDVYFYMGDPDKVKHRHHMAGPINPSGTWNEGTRPFVLKEGDSEFTVVVDPTGKIDDPDRSNNEKTLTVTVKDGVIDDTQVKI